MKFEVLLFLQQPKVFCSKFIMPPMLPRSFDFFSCFELKLNRITIYFQKQKICILTCNQLIRSYNYYTKEQTMSW